jgi:hypothetical protein
MITMQTNKERKQHNETTRNETRNSREDKENLRGIDTAKGDVHNAVDDEVSTAGMDTSDSGIKSPASLRRRSKYFRNDTL